MRVTVFTCGAISSTSVTTRNTREDALAVLNEHVSAGNSH